jgi:hypothetical protein
MTADIKRIFICAVPGVPFGMVTGYFGEFISHHIEGLPYSGIDDPWYWWLVIPAMPGDALVFNIYNLSDSYLSDEWEYRIPVSIFNGLFWMVFALVAAMLFPLAKYIAGKTLSRLFPKRAS